MVIFLGPLVLVGGTRVVLSGGGLIQIGAPS